MKPDTTIQLHLTASQANRLRELYESGALSSILHAEVSHLEQVQVTSVQRDGNIAVMDVNEYVPSEYQIALFDRPIYPELLTIKARKIFQRGEYQLEVWIMPGAHTLRFEYSDKFCTTEVLWDGTKRTSSIGMVKQFSCIDESEFEYEFPSARVSYSAFTQTEMLSESLYNSTYLELLEMATINQALTYRWHDDVGKCLSLVDIQPHLRSVHAQSYHLLAHSGMVLRTQSIFELM